MLTEFPLRKILAVSLLSTSILIIPATVRSADEFESMSKMVNLMDSFFGLMDSVYEMNADEEKAALLQMHEIEEIYKQQGKHQNAVQVYEQVLQKSKNPTIRNIAYHRMADVLKESGNLDAAVNTLNKALNENLKRTK